MYNYYNTGVTVELGEIVESGVKVWDFDYPIPRSEIEYNGKVCKVDFDKVAFEQKILDHYRFRQIGFETVGRFLHYFRTRIREIMPYYVQVYEFDAKFRNIDDPLESYNLMETFEQETSDKGKVTGNTTSNTNNTTENTTRFSDTPQGSVDNLDNYLTEATKQNGTETGNVTGNSTQNTEGNGTVKHTLNRRGNIGVQPLGGEVQNIRSAFINIDLQIINELKDLFLQVY